MRDLVEEALQQFDLAVADDARQLAVHAQEAAFARQQRDADRGLAEGQPEEFLAFLQAQPAWRRKVTSWPIRSSRSPPAWRVRRILNSNQRTPSA
jgi:hypothetical protein